MCESAGCREPEEAAARELTGSKSSIKHFTVTVKPVVTALHAAEMTALSTGLLIKVVGIMPSVRVRF